jgi:hypothetical protein
MAYASEIEASQIIQADEDRPGERGQMADAARHTMRTCHLLGGTTALGVAIVLALIAVRVARYPASIQGPGNSLLWTNVTLLLVYGLAAIWVSYQSRVDVRTAIRIGAITGLLLGAVHVANHLIELFVPARNFALVISPVFLMFALLGAAGSAAWQRTRSLALAVVAGLWCAVVATVILISVALVLDVVFETRAELPLREAFSASGMTDPGAFLLRNSLEAASEGLVRMPVFALVFSLIGAVANAWITQWPRNAALAGVGIAPLVLVMGAAALLHANSLERSARPPFVMAGVLLAGVALSAAHPIWSALRPSRQNR